MTSHPTSKHSNAAIESLEPRRLLSGGATALRLPANDLAPAAATSYIYTPLTDPSGAKYTQANGVSGNTIVGYYVDSAHNGHGFIFNGSTYTTLNDPSAASVQGTTATGISGSTIVGYYYDSHSVIHGFVYNDATRTFATLNDPNAGQAANEGTFAQGISGDTIVGWYVQSGGVVHGFTYDAITGIYATLDNPFAGHALDQGTFATGVAESVIVGYYSQSNGAVHGFMYDGSTFATVDDPLAIDTRAIGISDGDIVGWYYDASAVIHGFMYDGSAYTTLDDPAGSATHATGISGSTIVGYYTDGAGAVHGFTASPGVSGPPDNITGLVFNDHNGDGIQERRDGGLVGITLTLQQIKHGALHGRALTTTTNANGDYFFTNVAPATYRVSEVLPRHDVLTLPSAGDYTIALASGQTSSGNNFGDQKKTTPSVASAAHAGVPFEMTADLEALPLAQTGASVLFTDPTQAPFAG
jgi:hypothetical protein